MLYTLYIYMHFKNTHVIILVYVTGIQNRTFGVDVDVITSDYAIIPEIERHTICRSSKVP